MIAGLSDKDLDRTAPLIAGMHELAAAHQATIGQIALTWLANYYGDTVGAIPGASKRSTRGCRKRGVRTVLDEQQPVLDTQAVSAYPPSTSTLIDEPPVALLARATVVCMVSLALRGKG